ncbi:MAG: hypothetical protein HN366_05335 [Deltaproteobacteria bacterium]|jgi:hypothetical protein|nr:hypothetical protein [Deltaproteobacteria bacterium]
MKILGMILSALGAFGFVFYTIILSTGDNYTEAGLIWPICLWVGLTIVGIIIMSRPRKKPFPYN